MRMLARIYKNKDTNGQGRHSHYIPGYGQDA